MSQIHGPLLAHLPRRVSEQPANRKADYCPSQAHLRQEPSVPWRIAPLRVHHWVILGLCVLLVARALANPLPPVADGQDPEQIVQPAVLCVTCTTPAYRSIYTMRQPVNFSPWPLTCRTGDRQSPGCADLPSVYQNSHATAPGNVHVCPPRARPEPEQTTEPQSDAPTDPDAVEGPRR